MTPAKGKTEAQVRDPAVEAEALREEIEQTRGELGDTVERKAQAKAGEVKENPAPIAGIAGGIAALILLLWIVRRR